MRRLDLVVTVDAQRVRPLIVGEDEDDVRRALGLRRLGAGGEARGGRGSNKVAAMHSVILDC